MDETTNTVSEGLKLQVTIHLEGLSGRIVESSSCSAMHEPLTILSTIQIDSARK